MKRLELLIPYMRSKLKSSNVCWAQSKFGSCPRDSSRNAILLINGDRVYYPGLASHPQHELAKRQMSGFDGMVSFTLKGPEQRAIDFANRMHYFSLAESLGGVESLICHPARMTHGSIPKEDRERRGVTDGLLRLSVGIEDVDDLIGDLDQALEKSLSAAALEAGVRH